MDKFLEISEITTFTEQEVIAHFESCEQVGLSQEEAEKRMGILGTNEMKEEEKETIWEKLYEQFDDPMVKLLLLAAFISFGISLLSNMSGQESELPVWIEPAVIFMILIANGLIGLYQDYNADKSIETLKGLQSRYCTVLRDGVWREIKTEFLTVGDIVTCSVGEVVPADMRILTVQSTSIKVDQSNLNGETVPINKVSKKLSKTKSAFDQKNMLFSGSPILFGKCIAIVVCVGENTEIGKIKQEIELAKKDTQDQLPPLKKQLNDFGEFLAYAIAIICLLIWLLSFPNFFDENQGGFILGSLYYFKQAVALGVAAIPEGLPAVITTCLALGTRRMIKRNALVRKLPAVETLGCTQVICSDKTGTLTKNEMIVKKFCLFDKSNKLRYIESDGIPYSENQQLSLQDEKNWENLKMITLNMVKNTETKIHHENDSFICQGLPTEGALMSLGQSMMTVNKVKIEKAEKLFTFHFDSERKMMSVLVRDFETKKRHLMVKGAAEIIIENCTTFLNGNGETVEMGEEAKQGLLRDVQTLAQGGYRVLGLSYKQELRILEKYDGENSGECFQYMIDSKNLSEIEKNAVFLGLVCIEDPIKENVKESIILAQQAGITIYMITGDFQTTALSIAKQINLVDQKTTLDDKRVFLGEQLDSMESEELTKIIKNSIEKQESLIFARTTPAHKRLLVQIISKLDYIVSMTGDGVNDAPALKQASIGIAMGIHGTDVAKESSDMILVDDNFATIIAAIEEGRSIYANMKAFIRYMISSNIGEVISIFITSLLGIPEGFNSIQLLWVNLVTDGLPATALSFNQPDPDCLKRPPRKTNEKLVDKWIITRYMVVGVYVGLATSMIFVYYYTSYYWSDEQHPLISFSQLRNWHQCADWNVQGYADACDLFTVDKKKASTLSLTVLVMIEMFNALNAMSEDQGLLTIGLFNNLWLWGAIFVSTLLHCLILYVPFLARIFSTVPLSTVDWLLVLVFTIPVIFVEEILKWVSRMRNKQIYGNKKNN